jgi:hypothetical protein
MLVYVSYTIVKTTMYEQLLDAIYDDHKKGVRK